MTVDLQRWAALAPAAVYVKDAEGRYLFANDAAARMLGRTRAADLIGRCDAELFDADAVPEVRAIDQHVASSRAVLRYEVRRTVAGRERVLATTKYPYLDEAGRVVGVAGISQDVTDERRRQREALAAVVATASEVERVAPGAAEDLRRAVARLVASLAHATGPAPRPPQGGPRPEA